MARRHHRDHPLDQVLGDVSSGVRTRRQVQNEVEFRAFLSQIEPTSVEQALEDCDWIIVMQEEFNQFAMGTSPKAVSSIHSWDQMSLQEQTG